MSYKFKITITWAVTVIGVSCIGGGLGTIIGYVYGWNNFSRWLGNVPMAFSTSCFIFFIGVALYLIGKYGLQHDKFIG